MTCENLCTAATCAELERRIEELEENYRTLLDAFLTHKDGDVYQGHNYQPNIDIFLDFYNNQLTVQINLDGTPSQDTVDLSELIVDDFGIEIIDLGSNFYQLQLIINNITSSSDFTFAEPTIDFETYQLDNTTIGWSLIYNEFQDQGEFNIILPEVEEVEYTPSNLQLDGTYQDDYLTLNISDGESSDSIQIFIDAEDITNINGGGGQEVNCDEITDAIDNCCAQILTAIQTSETFLDGEIQKVEDALNVPVNDIINVEYQCVPEEDKDGNPIPDSKLQETNQLTIDTIGLNGLVQYSRNISRNLDSIHKEICEGIKLMENPDTVTLLASERDVGRVEGNVLILHFVTLDNYPKRQAGSSPRVIRIPEPKDEYDWGTDFKDIRWEQGNQFARLKLEGWKQGVSGWFKDAAAANACFDQLIQLTNAKETGRSIPIHTNPRTDIQVRPTRPYRAFISREVNPGEGETLFKYLPPADEEEN